MKGIVTRILLGMLVWSPVVIAQPLGAAQPKKLRLAFSVFAYANPPFWIAHELAAAVEAQRTISQLLKQNLPLSLEGVRFVLDHYAERQPNLINKNPSDFVDMRFVRKLEEQGFFKKFASK